MARSLMEVLRHESPDAVTELVAYSDLSSEGIEPAQDKMKLWISRQHAVGRECGRWVEENSPNTIYYACCIIRVHCSVALCIKPAPASSIKLQPERPGIAFLS